MQHKLMFGGLTGVKLTTSLITLMWAISLCYKSKETSRCEIVHKLMCREMNHKLMCCQIGNTLIYGEVSHNLIPPVQWIISLQAWTGMRVFAVKLLMLIVCAVRFTINIRGVTWIISPNFEADKMPQFITN